MHVLCFRHYTYNNLEFISLHLLYIEVDLPHLMHFIAFDSNLFHYLRWIPVSLCFRRKVFFPQNEHFSLSLIIFQVTGKKNECTKILEQVFYKKTQELLFKCHGEGYAIYHWIPLHRIRKVHEIINLYISILYSQFHVYHFQSLKFRGYKSLNCDK